MKILYVTTIGITMGFFKTFIKELVDSGHTVDIASNEDEWAAPEFFDEIGCKRYNLSCSRSPFSKGNIDCVKQLKKLVTENEYDIVHCHTPIAAACTRIACKDIRKQRKNTDHPLRVFYTAHGFHFYKGSPKKNWIIFYPIEKLCAKWTDVLITINKEDYNLAKNKFEGLGKNKQFEGCKVEYVPGVGIDVDKFANTVVDKAAKRKELGVPEDAFMIASAGELNANKNHEVIIRAIAEFNQPDVYFVIAGVGELRTYLLGLANSLGISKQVILLGWRDDVAEIYKASDVCSFTSIREGLGLAALEAMASGLPLICSDNRGTRDYAVSSGSSGDNAFVAMVSDVSGFASCIQKVYDNHSLVYSMRESAYSMSCNFSQSVVSSATKRIYGV